MEEGCRAELALAAERVATGRRDSASRHRDREMLKRTYVAQWDTDALVVWSDYIGTPYAAALNATGG
jgi:hypothetical protein